MIGTDNIIDISHYNGPSLDFEKASASGIVGVLHKASDGSTYIDPMYDQNRQNATAAGMKWGAYHYWENDPVDSQVQNFLGAVGNLQQVLLAVDVEISAVSWDQVGQFTAAVHERTGQWPGIYSNLSTLKSLTSGDGSQLAESWLWLAYYSSEVPESPVPSIWPTWTIWQYTQSAQVPGITDSEHPCDRDTFNGSEAELMRLWGVD